jgi:hypothetical protein
MDSKRSKIEMADEINYLGLVFESNGGWKRQRFKTVAKGNKILVAIDKCLAKTPLIKVKILQTVYEMLSLA